MSVKKSVLQSKRDVELQKYLLTGNTYVPEAVAYAFEILKARGKTFSEEETQRIVQLIADKEKQALEPEPKPKEIDPKNKSENNIILIALIFIYCAYGVIVDDLFIPNRRGTGGKHLFGQNAWLFFTGIACVLAIYIINHFNTFHQKENNKFKKH